MVAGDLVSTNASDVTPFTSTVVNTTGRSFSCGISLACFGCVHDLSLLWAIFASRNSYQSFSIRVFKCCSLHSIIVTVPVIVVLRPWASRSPPSFHAAIVTFPLLDRLGIARRWLFASFLRVDWPWLVSSPSHGHGFLCLLGSPAVACSSSRLGRVQFSAFRFFDSCLHQQTSFHTKRLRLQLRAESHNELVS